MAWALWSGAWHGPSGVVHGPSCVICRDTAAAGGALGALSKYGSWPGTPVGRARGGIVGWLAGLAAVLWHPAHGCGYVSHPDV